MTIVRTHETRGAFLNAGTTARSSASFTPNANELLCVCFAMEVDSANTAATAPTLTATGYSFTERQRQQSGPTGVFAIQTAIYTAPGLSSPSAVTVQFDNTNSVYRWVWEIFTLSNVDTSSPVIGSGGSDSESGNPGTMNATLSSAPESNSHTVGIIALDTNNAARVAAASGFTQINEDAAEYPLTNISERTASTSTAVAWTVTSFSGEGSGGSCCAVAFRHAPAASTDLEPWKREAKSGLIVPATLTRASAW